MPKLIQHWNLCLCQALGKGSLTHTENHEWSRPLDARRHGFPLAPVIEYGRESRPPATHEHILDISAVATGKVAAAGIGADGVGRGKKKLLPRDRKKNRKVE